MTELEEALGYTRKKCSHIYLVMDDTRKSRITKKDTTTTLQRQLDEVEAKSAKDNQTLLIALTQELGT